MTKKISDKIPKGTTLKELEKTFKKLKKKGLEPFIKGKGSGKIKLGFE